MYDIFNKEIKCSSYLTKWFKQGPQKARIMEKKKNVWKEVNNIVYNTSVHCTKLKITNK